MPRGLGAYFGPGRNGSVAVDISGEDASVRPVIIVEARTDQAAREPLNNPSIMAHWRY